MLQGRPNTMSFHIKVRATPIGTINEVLKKIGAEIIANAATEQFTATATDVHTQQCYGIDEAVFIGGQVIKLAQSQYSDAIVANSVSVQIPVSVDL